MKNIPGILKENLKLKKKRESNTTQNLSYVAVIFDRLFIKILRYDVLMLYIYIYILPKHMLLSFFALGSIFAGLEISPHTCHRFLYSQRFIFTNIYRQVYVFLLLNYLNIILYYVPYLLLFLNLSIHPLRSSLFSMIPYPHKIGYWCQAYVIEV